MPDIDEAIDLAARLLDLAEMLPDPTTDYVLTEYVRGMANILGELYPIVGMPLDERSDQIASRIWRLAGAPNA